VAWLCRRSWNRTRVSALQEVEEFIRQAIGLLRQTILPCANQRLLVLPNAQLQQVLGLLALATAQLLNHELRQREYGDGCEGRGQPVVTSTWGLGVLPKRFYPRR
jgi:hypothetical protein